MLRLFGFLKVALVLAVDFFLIYSLGGNVRVAAIVVGIVAFYAVFGGYPALWKKGAVKTKKLPDSQRNKLETAKAQLVEDVKQTSGVNISGLKVYLIPGDTTVNAHAYGANCISVNRGQLDSSDLNTLKSVMAHEISHTLNCDAEFNRAVFCSVTLLVRLLSVVSFCIVIAAFLVLLLLRCLGLRLGALVFRGATSLCNRMIYLSQRIILVAYRTLISILRRHCEYRSDRYACTLGYGAYLARDLARSASMNPPKMSLTEVLYSTHPPTKKRIARLEKQIGKQKIV